LVREEKKKRMVNGTKERDKGGGGRRKERAREERKGSVCTNTPPSTPLAVSANTHTLSLLDLSAHSIPYPPGTHTHAGKTLRHHHSKYPAIILQRPEHAPYQHMPQGLRVRERSTVQLLPDLV
jgi:hypothetical protein